MAPPLLVALISFLHGTITYTLGSATIHQYGHIGINSDNAVPGPHCHPRNHGCVVNPNTRSLLHTPNNTAVMLMARWFGPMPGTYSGHYPNALEAYRRLQRATATLTPEELKSGSFLIQGQRVTLKADYRKRQSSYWNDEPERYLADLIDNRLLILAKPMRFVGATFDFATESLDSQYDLEPIFLIDTVSARHFAMYTPADIERAMVKDWQNHHTQVSGDRPPATPHVRSLAE